MAGVADDEANVVLAGKLQCLSDMYGRRDIDCISNEVAKGAWFGDGVVWIACPIREERGHERGRGIITEAG